MDEEIKIEVKYELFDFLKLNFWVLRKFKKSVILIISVWMIFVLVFFSSEAISKDIRLAINDLFFKHRWMITLPILLLLFLGFNYFTIYNIGKRNISKNSIWNEKKVITINDEYIGSVSESTSLKLKWENIQKYFVLKDLIVLFYSKSATLLIPMRFIGGKEESIIKIIQKHADKK